MIESLPSLPPMRQRTVLQKLIGWQMLNRTKRPGLWPDRFGEMRSMSPEGPPRTLINDSIGRNAPAPYWACFMAGHFKEPMSAKGIQAWK